ncbi:hypothetical protein SKAU_G00411990 [Synaphobranchus kaupii]|uniref:ribonuclease H n=1 Tax=Synaphobranchus kaupii TaxID=118154 RepID=A0A9Q1E7Y9_SYNKA|nr:hypothetical protein SKAU_G00411990 [Synaphobranchus kaupii]
MDHQICMAPGTVFNVHPYRVPEARKQAIIAEVQRIKSLGVIEETYSPRFSPIVMVPKPDGSLWFCNDFRSLSAISKVDAYPMLRADELIEHLDVVLRPCQSFAATYLDDIVVHSQVCNKLLCHIHQVLEVLRRAGLTANLTKCHLAQNKAHYLGYTIGWGLVKPQLKKNCSSAGLAPAHNQNSRQNGRKRQLEKISWG